MDTPGKIYKATLSCRLNPRLKDVIQKEASEKGITPSSYIESILENRYSTLSEKERKDFRDDIDTLEFEIEELKTELSMRDGVLKDFAKTTEALKLKRAEVLQLEKTIKENRIKCEKEMTRMRKTSVSFDADQVESFNLNAKALREFYPDISMPDLIIASLGTSVKNENSTFSIHLIKGQLK